MPLVPAELSDVDKSLVAVGLAQYPQVPSIMDSINKPVPYKPSPAPAPVVIQAAAPNPDFIPSPAPGPAPMKAPVASGPAPMKAPAPGPATSPSS